MGSNRWYERTTKSKNKNRHHVDHFGDSTVDSCGQKNHQNLTVKVNRVKREKKEKSPRKFQIPNSIPPRLNIINEQNY